MSFVKLWWSRLLITKILDDWDIDIDGGLHVDILAVSSNLFRKNRWFYFIAFSVEHK